MVNMFKLFLLLSVISFIGLVQSLEKLEENPEVSTQYGQIIGTRYTNALVGNDYYMFMGIPYAAPPVGDLRFQDPIPHPGWNEIRNASAHGANCYNTQGIGATESEDCLFINVYTTNLTDNRPVMVFIHGGAFSSGSGDATMYGPDHFIKEDVILVTFNYRLGVFGYLNTNDENAQGNAGMKDQIQALRWVQKNIRNFGGDPERVTVFGQSSGAASVQYLILSPMAVGLFHQAICQSGTVFMPGSFQRNPVDIAFALGENLNITFSTTTELVTILKELDPQAILAADPGGVLMGALSFTPSIERSFDEEVFLAEHPVDILKSGNFSHIPLINGFTDSEALIFGSPLILPTSDLETIDENRYLMIPPEWNIERGSQDEQEIVDTIWKFYFDDESITDDHRESFAKLVTDQRFVFPADLSVRLHAQAQNDPVFYYTFSFDGTLNLNKAMVGMEMFPGAAHSEDNMYLFDISRLVPIELADDDPAGTMRDTFVRLWANFAKFGLVLTF